MNRVEFEESVSGISRARLITLVNQAGGTVQKGAKAPAIVEQLWELHKALTAPTTTSYILDSALPSGAAEGYVRHLAEGGERWLSRWSLEDVEGQDYWEVTRSRIGDVVDVKLVLAPKPEPVKMDQFRACMIAEGVQEADEDERVEAWQYLLDTGLCWQLQGWYGRTAQRLIEIGVITRKES